MTYFKTFIASLLDILTDFIYWIYDWFSGGALVWIMDIMNAAFAMLPANMTYDVSLLSPWVDVVNFWIPLDLLLGLITAYIPIVVAMYTVRHAIKLIPTIG